MNKNKTWFKWMNNAVLNEQWPADEGWPHAGVWRTASPHRMTRLCCRWPPEPSEQTQSHHSRGFSDTDLQWTDGLTCCRYWLSVMWAILTSDLWSSSAETRAFIHCVYNEQKRCCLHQHSQTQRPSWRTVMNSFHPEVLRILRCSAAANSHIHLQILCFP